MPTFNSSVPGKWILMGSILVLFSPSYASTEQPGLELIEDYSVPRGAIEQQSEDQGVEIILALETAQAEDPALEFQMINKAQSSGAVEDYQAYLNRYPTGIFVDLAKAEIDSASAKSSKAEPRADSEKSSDSASLVSVTGTEVINMDTPLAESVAILGEPKSIGQLAKGSPLHPPFEGLEESYWKNEQCSNCHEWSKPNLCEQGIFYTNAAPEAIERIKHPYGGFFKTALRLWAAADCQ